LSGTNESQTMVSDMQAASQAMRNNGFSTNEINLQTRTDGAHSEWFWAREFRAGFLWLFANQTTDIEQIEVVKRFNITINGSSISIQAEEKINQLTLFNAMGQAVLQTNTHPDLLDLSGLSKGVYFLNALFKDKHNEVIKFIY
jgi:hypothetical protein